jgi:hypothetical protein
MNTRLMKQWLCGVALLTLLAGCAGSRREAVQQEPALVSSQDLATATRADLATGVPVQGTLDRLWTSDHRAALRSGRRAGQGGAGGTQAPGAGALPARVHRSGGGQRRGAAPHGRRGLHAHAEPAKEGAVAPRPENAEAALKAAQAQAALAGKSFDEGDGPRPFDGVIARRFVQSGNRLGDGDPVPGREYRRARSSPPACPPEALSQVRPALRSRSR